MLVRSSKLKFVYIWRSKKQWIGWCAELLTTSKCTNAKSKVQVAISLAVVEVQKAVEECAEQVCRAKLEVSGEYQKGWFTLTKKITAGSATVSRTIHAPDFGYRDIILYAPALHS